MSLVLNAIRDHAQGELDEIDADIAKLADKMALLGRRRATLMGIILLHAEHTAAENGAEDAR